jgi:two-component system chemotaxis response regulator CheB
MDQLPEKDFNGHLEGITLVDIVQLACLERYESKLEIWGENFRGTIFFSGGEMVHAETGSLTGQEAFFKILCCPAGIFSFTPAKTERQTIDVSWNFLLMEAARQVDERADTGAADSGYQQLKILVVDDSRIFTQALIKLFDEEVGAKIVGKASNGEEALKCIEMEKPDLVTLDINMSVMNGNAALKHIMIRTPAPVVLMSSFNEENFPLMMDYLCIGAVDLVEKPDDAPSLNIVKKRLGRLVRNISQFTLKNVRRAPKPRPVEHKLALGGPAEKLVLLLGGLGSLIELQKYITSVHHGEATAGLAFLDLYPGVTNHLAAYFDGVTSCNPLALTPEVPLLSSLFGITYWHGSWELSQDEDGTVVPLMKKDSGLLDADTLLKSAAELFSTRLTIVILSGTDLDIQSGLAEVSENGGRILLQNPDSCLFPDPLVRLEQMQLHDGFLGEGTIQDNP